MSTIDETIEKELENELDSAIENAVLCISELALQEKKIDNICSMSEYMKEILRDCGTTIKNINKWFPGLTRFTRFTRHVKLNNEHAINEIVKEEKSACPSVNNNKISYLKELAIEIGDKLDNHNTKLENATTKVSYNLHTIKKLNKNI